VSGCQSSVAEGKIDAEFSLTPKSQLADGPIYLYPASLTLYATLSECFPGESSNESRCVLIASSEPFTIIVSLIGAPPEP